MKKINEFFSNKIFKIIFGLLRFVVYGFLIVYVAFTLFQRFTNNSSFYGYRLFNVATGSMIPVYNINDVIIVKETDVTTLKVGDDVAYKGTRAGLEGKIITHRIIKIEEDNNGELRFFTQGVNSLNADPSITGDQILGKVEGKLFFINELNHVVKSNLGFFFLVFCPLILVIALEIAQSVIEYKLEKNEIQEISSKKKKDRKEEKVEVKEETKVVEKEEKTEVKEEKEEKTEVKEEKEEEIELLD